MRARLTGIVIAALGTGLLMVPEAAAGSVGKIAFPENADLPRTSFDSYQFGLSRSGSGRTFSPIALTARVSKSSPALFSYTARGLHIPSAVISFDEGPLEVCLAEAELTNFEQTTKASGVVESYELEFNRILVSVDFATAVIPVAGYDVGGNANWSGPCP